MQSMRFQEDRPELQTSRSCVDGALARALDEVMASAGLLTRQPLSRDGRAQCEALMASARLAQALLADLTEAAPDVSSEPVSLQEIADEIDDAWQARAGERGAGLVMSCRIEGDLLARFDSRGFRRMLDGLIGAALEATPGGVVEVTLRASVDEARIRLAAGVSDPGGAFATGAGGVADSALAASRAWLVTAGGELSVGTGQGVGHRVTFALMIDPARVDAPSEPAETPAASGPQVLIVDDNATNRMVAEALCEMFGLHSEVACDGQEALEAVQQRDFDLILMDIRMPRLDGVQATRAIRALGGAAAGVPIVALTANAEPSDVREYLAAGMCTVVEKPIKPDRLLQAITQALTPPENAGLFEGRERSAA